MQQWSKNKENKLIKLYPYNTDDEVAKILKLSRSFVMKKAQELGLTKEKPAKRDWSAEEVEYINKLYPTYSNGFLARKLNAYKWQIEHIAYRMELRKEKGYFKVEPDNNNLVDEWEKEWKDEGFRCSKGHYLTGKILKHLFPYHRVEEEQPIGSLWIDWLVPQLNIAVEVNGIQHSEFSDFYHRTKSDFEKGQQNDWDKSEMLESKNISLIVIYHDEKISINLIKKKLEEII